MSRVPRYDGDLEARPDVRRLPSTKRTFANVAFGSKADVCLTPNTRIRLDSVSGDRLMNPRGVKTYPRRRKALPAYTHAE